MQFSLCYYDLGLCFEILLLFSKVLLFAKICFAFPVVYFFMYLPVLKVNFHLENRHKQVTRFH